MLDSFFTGKVQAATGRKAYKHSEEELEECRDLLAMETGMRKDAYCHLKQELYAHVKITPAQQLFVDKIDQVFHRHARRFSNSEVINADVNKITI